MKIEIDYDFADEIVTNRLLENIQTMDDYLKRYKDPDHGYIAMFSTDEKEDIRKIREMRTAMALVAGWYHEDVEPLEPIERKPLTDNEILALNGDEDGYIIAAPDCELIQFARAIEAKLKELKNERTNSKTC